MLDQRPRDERIAEHEGLRLTKYQDEDGNWTIYVGHLCKKDEIYLGTKEDAMKYLAQDLKIAERDAGSLFPDYKNMSQNRQEALVELCFNMGRTRIAHKFPQFVHNVNTKQWESAGDELQYANGRTKLSLSGWYKQVKEHRAEDILERIREG